MGGERMLVGVDWERLIPRAIDPGTLIPVRAELLRSIRDHIFMLEDRVRKQQITMQDLNTTIDRLRPADDESWRTCDHVWILASILDGDGHGVVRCGGCYATREVRGLSEAETEDFYDGAQVEIEARRIKF